MADRCVLWITAALAMACAGTQYGSGASDANLTRARGAAPEGAALFERQCASCHGARGESGTSAPRVLGEGALPEFPRARDVNASASSGDPEALRLEAQSRPLGAPWRDPFRTAQDLYTFVSTKMPPSQETREELTPADYWAIVHFMLLAHGVQVPPEGITDKNASSVRL